MEITIRNTSDGTISLTNPILLNGASTCYRCNEKINVFAFACIPYGNKSQYEMPIFSYVTKIEPLLENIINSTRIKKIFFKDYSNTTKSYYYMNHCQFCHAKRGDFFLHEEPDGPFLIQKETKLSDLYYFKLNDNSDDIFKFDATLMIENFETYPVFKKEKIIENFKL